jgi:hypothetical protein
MSLYRRLALLVVGFVAATGTLLAQTPKIDKIGAEELVASIFMDRPSVATDSKGEPHFVCDAGGNANLMKYHRINGKWRGGVFATGARGGRYSASRLYIGQMEIDSKDRAWISCKFGCKEFGSMLGQGIWLYRNVTTSPSEQFFRHVNVYKGMGVVSIDAKYPDEGVVMGTFGNYERLSQYGQTLGSGSINGGHGGEKVRLRIASYAPKYPAKDDAKAYPDGVWHTAMNGSSATGAGFYQNSTRYRAGMGPVWWAAYRPYPIMGDDYHHPGVGIDATDPKYAYISTVFYGNLCINIWDGSKMLFDPTSLKVVSPAGFESRHAPACTPAPGTEGGVFFFWTLNNRIKAAHVSKKGVVGTIKDITEGHSAGAATDRYGNIHLVYYNGGIKYRKLLVSTLEPLTPKGAVTDRTPQFRWTNTKAAQYTVEITKDGSKLPTVTIGGATWTPGTELAVGDYSWRVKEGGSGSANKWSQSLDFTIPPVIPDPLAPAERFNAAVTPAFEWSNIDPDATRYTIELFNGADSLGTLNATGDVKNGLILTANWNSLLNAGLYSWRIKSTRALTGHTISSSWTEPMAFQVLVPGPTAIVQPGEGYTFAPGNDTLTCIWTPAEGATAYKLKVLYNGELLDTYPNIVDTNFPMTRYFHPGYHTLLVQPQNVSGNGAWSAPVTILVRRNMKPANDVTLDESPGKLTWTRTKEATRYLLKLAQYNQATHTYVVFREKWIDQSAFGTDPLWNPASDLPTGAYRWSITDYFGKKQGYTSMAYFQVKVPGRPDLVQPIGATSGHRNLGFYWNDPSEKGNEYQIQIWKGNTKVKDTGWLPEADVKRIADFSKVFSFADDAGGAYTWQVRSRNFKGTGPWKSAGFTLATLATPVITAPAAAANIDSSTEFTISWDAVSGADQYEVEVLEGVTPISTTFTSDLSVKVTLSTTGARTIRVTAWAEGASRPAERAITIVPL